MTVRKLSLLQIVSLLLFFAVLIFSVVLFIVHNPGVRRVFIFESFDDDRLYLESRDIPSFRREHGVSPYKQYIEELISGTVTDRYRPLFNSSTRLESCIFHDGRLYVNLSEEALLATGSSSSTEVACELLKKNIHTNFSSVRKVYVFINGLPVYKGFVSELSD